APNGRTGPLSTWLGFFSAAGCFVGSGVRAPRIPVGGGEGLTTGGEAGFAAGLGGISACAGDWAAAAGLLKFGILPPIAPYTWFSSLPISIYFCLILSACVAIFGVAGPGAASGGGAGNDCATRCSGGVSGIS